MHLTVLIPVANLTLNSSTTCTPKGLFVFASFGHAAGGRCILKNLDSPRVLKNPHFNTKWTGQEKRRWEESVKTQSVWCHSK
jgi:hypothetical protein